MSVGFARGKAEIDFRAGQLVVVLRDTFGDVRQFKTMLDSRTDAELLALGYTAGDVTVLRGAYAALVKLADVAVAQAIVPVPDDFMFHARQLTGVR